MFLDHITLLQYAAEEQLGPRHQHQMLQLFLLLDKVPEDKDEEIILRGIRKAQMKLAAYYLYSCNIDTSRYALACEILRVANSRTGCQLNKVLYAMPGKKKFSKVKLRREDFGKRDAMMGQPVPIVHIDTGKPFEIPHEGTLKCKLKLPK